MGQKVHPTGYRIGTIEPWRSRWYASKKDFPKMLVQDRKIREYIEKEFGSAGIPRIEIERSGEAVNVIIYTARPGVLVGRKGVRVEQLKLDLQKLTGMTCHLTLHEVKRPELESKLVAEVVAEALERRMACAGKGVLGDQPLGEAVSGFKSQGSNVCHRRPPNSPRSRVASVCLASGWSRLPVSFQIF